jgi:hypothetical protein
MTNLIVTVHNHPESADCMECIHGIMLDEYDSAGVDWRIQPPAAICVKLFHRDPREPCPFKERRAQDDIR